MRTVKEVSKLTGVSVRTLHHYDAIGLLKPTEVTKAGYRLYDDTALGRLQNILLFRELRFPLKEIKAILDSPDFDPSEALAQQIRLLELQYKHLGELISFAREIQEKGVRKMDFHVFDKSEIEEYKAEAKEKWGKMIERYLRWSRMLKLVFLLVDIRHDPSANDKSMYDWIVYNGYHPVVIATKLDKINRSQRAKQLKTIRQGLGMGAEDILIPFSAETKEGREEIWELLERTVQDFQTN